MHYPCEISSIRPPGIGCFFLYHQGTYKIVSCVSTVLTKNRLGLKINSRKETIDKMLLPLRNTIGSIQVSSNSFSRETDSSIAIQLREKQNLNYYQACFCEEQVTKAPGLTHELLPKGQKVTLLILQKICIQRGIGAISRQLAFFCIEDVESPLLSSVQHDIYQISAIGFPFVIRLDIMEQQRGERLPRNWTVQSLEALHFQMMESVRLFSRSSS